MPDYDFKSLSPIDFEILVRDLLQEELDVRFESFKSGRDQGIDLRYCSNGDHTLIIQCKHYVESSYIGLFRQLKSNELEKVKKLSPSRYILATSLGLTPHQKQELMKLFEPFILSPSDIYGKNDLNNLLTSFPRIEKQNFKLWLASIPIFEEILHSKVRNVSRDALENIRAHAKLYVQNESFSEALRILNDHNFCIIAGIPGIGKTILAEMLSLHFVDLGYDIVKITGDISEANSMDYANLKRVFYYDDFLGQTSSFEKLNKNEDQKLLDFIQTLKRSKVSKLILTTREYILNQARIKYEKIDRSRFNLETCVIDLSKYTRSIRAKILFNHIYFSELPAEYKEVLLSERNYLRIIDHQNFNPRIINLMTEFSRFTHIEPNQYIEFFITNLENPIEIWRHVFEEQITLSSKNLLIVMVSMPGEIFLEDLEEAFIAFHQKLSTEYCFGTTPSDFMHALKELDGNFISLEKSRNRTIIRFHNPSVRDFVQNYLASRKAELLTLIKEAKFFEQIMWLWEFSENIRGALKFRRIIIENSAYLIDSLYATINSRSCGLTNHRDFAGELYKDTWEISIEARVIFVVSIATHLKNKDSTKFINEMLDLIEKRIQNESVNREDLVHLIIKLKNLDIISPDKKHSLLDKAKSFLIFNLNCIDEFESFWDFVDSFPELITDKDKVAIREEFKEVGKNEIAEIVSNSYTNDPDFIRQDANKLESLAKRFDVDMTNSLARLEEHIEYLETNAPFKKEKYKYRSGWKIESDNCSDQDIESMFKTLNE